MRYLSVCSGIEAASVAWHHLGWEPVGFSEIEPFPAAVLAHRFPNIPNYGDMTKHESWPINRGAIDLLVGGTPCQSFSVAGLRQGLADPRGNLMLTYLAIADRLRPRWLVWENVGGVLSSNGGRDFGTFLGSLVQLGYGFAYRVLDAQYVRVGGWPRAVPQRRRRVFVVGCFGDGAAAAEVLALEEGLRRHLEARRAKGKGVAADAEGGVARCITTGEMKRQDYETCTMIAQPTAYRWQNDRDGLQQDDAVAALRASQGASGFHEMNHPVIAQPVPYDLFQITAPVNRQNRAPGDPCHTLAKDNAAHAAVAFHPTQDPISSTDGSTHCMGTGSSRGDATIAVAQSMTVRRLTPRECERLQGFPDDWTMIPYRGKPPEECPDGPRYKALGNSMACNCMAWIGERIAAYEAQNGST
jgi:DNA (cytosine-5)-methyltransferase 1